MIFPGFVGGSYQSLSLSADVERTVNLYPEIIESGQGKGQAALYSTPGLAFFVQLPQQPVRSLYEVNGRLFAVAGSHLYEIYSAGGYQDFGTIGVGPNVSMASSGTSGHQLCVCSAGLIYILDLTSNTLTQINIAGSGFTAAAQVVYMDGYFIAFEPSTQEFFISNLFDGTTWQPLMFALAEGGPDNIVSMVVNERQLWLMGAYRTELYYDSGAAAFPLSRNNNAYVECGSAAQFGATQFMQTIAWLGRDKQGAGVVYMMQGYQAQRISNHAVETAIQGYSTISDCSTYSYQENGHSFLRLDFPGANATWVYDGTTRLWHERAYWDSANGKYVAHLARTHAYAFGKHLVGDYLSGNIYRQSLSVYTDNGAMIRRLRIAPHLSREMNMTFYSEFTLDMQTGIGLDRGITPGEFPMVAMSYSNDGGRTWTSDQTKSAGTIGEYKARVTWRRLGRARDRVFRIVISDPVPVCIVNAYLETKAGRK